MVTFFWLGSVLVMRRYRLELKLAVVCAWLGTKVGGAMTLPAHHDGSLSDAVRQVNQVKPHHAALQLTFDLQ